MISAALLRIGEAIRIVSSSSPLTVASQPLVMPALSNKREFHFRRAERHLAHRNVGRLILGPFGKALRGFFSLPASAAAQALAERTPLVVLITRVAPRQLDDDNAASACKAVRDGIADALGIDDRDPRVTWLVDQRKGPAAVEVEVFRGGQ